MNKTDLMKKIANEISEKMLETNIAPWRKTWSSKFASDVLYPTNLISNKAYRGMNVMILFATGYNSPYWVTELQARKLKTKEFIGKPTEIVYYFFIKNKEDDKKSIPVIKFYQVYNTEQCIGIENKKLIAQPEPDESEYQSITDSPAAVFINSYLELPETVFGSKASYTPSLDKITMPDHKTFDNLSEFYHTYFHEIGHSTGHINRLNRSTLTNFAGFGTKTYSKEELVAEICSYFLSRMTDIKSDFDNSIAYIKGWSKYIKNNPGEFYEAIVEAEKAAEYILARSKTIRARLADKKIRNRRIKKQ